MAQMRTLRLNKHLLIFWQRFDYDFGKEFALSVKHVGKISARGAAAPERQRSNCGAVAGQWRLRGAAGNGGGTVAVLWWRGSGTVAAQGRSGDGTVEAQGAVAQRNCFAQ